MNTFEFLKSQQTFIDKMSSFYNKQPVWIKNYNELQLKISKIQHVQEFNHLTKIDRYLKTFNRIEEFTSSSRKMKDIFNSVDSVTSKLRYLDYDFYKLVEDIKECEETENEKDSIIITETSRVKELIAEIYYNNLKLFSLHPREFEKIIAELLYNKGFDVELTKQTRDNGYDILALRYIDGFSPIKYLVECKRYAENRKIGVEIIRSFKEVLQTENANKGIIVTTSYFSKDALKKQKETPLLLDYKNKDEVIEWVNDYFNQKQLYL